MPFSSPQSTTMWPADNYKTDSRIDLEEEEEEVYQKSLDINEKGGGLVVEAEPSLTKEELEEKDLKSSKSKMENFKYYTSLFLGTLSIVCIFAFLFLVPFVLDPVRLSFVDLKSIFSLIPSESHNF